MKSFLSFRRSRAFLTSFRFNGCGSPAVWVALATLGTGGNLQALHEEVVIKNWTFEEDRKPSNGQPLPPLEFQFETPPYWSEATPKGSDSFTEHIPGFNHTGNNHEGISAGGAIWQDLQSGLTPNRHYSLIVAIGNRNATYTQANNQSVFKLLLNHNGLITELKSRTVFAGNVPPGTFETFNLTYETGATVPQGLLRVQLQVDSGDRAHFDSVQLVRCQFEQNPGNGPDHPQTPPWAQEAVPVLNSRPSAGAVLFLDFDGAFLPPMRQWNCGLPLTVSHSGLNALEIRRAFEVVKEDFLPFNLNVTTDESLYRNAGPLRRMRAIVTTSDDWMLREYGYNPKVLGRAETNSFREAGLTMDPALPAFIWLRSWNGSSFTDGGMQVGLNVSHEVGHTLGLGHDGGTNDDPYFSGHGTGGPVWGPFGSGSSTTGTRWAPIMGTNSVNTLSQWSRGEYNLANNLEDDVAIIAATGSGTNNFGYAPDDHGNSIDNASPLGLSGGGFSGSGMIGRSAAGGSESDYFRFTLPAPGRVDILFKPAEPFTDPDPLKAQEKNAGIANLRMIATLYNRDRSECCNAAWGADSPVIPDPASAAEKLNPVEYLRSRISRSLDAGTSWVKVAALDSVGLPATNGFSGYGNMGAYSISAAVTWTVPAITSGPVAAAMVSQIFSYTAEASPGPVTWSASGLPGGLAINGSTGVISGTPVAGGVFNVILRASTAMASGEETLVITVATPAPPAVLGPFTDTGEQGQPYSHQITASGGPASYGFTGDAIPGLSVNAATGAITGTPTIPGTHSMTLTVSNAWGSGSHAFTLTVRSSPAAALDTTVLAFSRPDAKPWFGQSAVSSDGTDAMQSPALNHGESSSIETTVTGPGTISYYRRADTEAGDTLSFSAGGSTVDTVSGNSGWQARSYAIPAGVQTLRWTFARNASGSGGSDTVWLDRVSWSAAAGPTITSPLTVNWTCGQGLILDLTSDDPATVWTMSGTLPQGVFFIGQSKIIGANPWRPGTFSVTLFATSALGTTTRVFTMYIESSYAGWARGNGLGAGSELGDQDRDGITNFAEFGFALDPFVRNPGFHPLSFDPATGRMRASFKRQSQFAPDLIYEVQVSGNLQHWTAIARANFSFMQNAGGAHSLTETNAPGSPYITDVVVVDGTLPSAAVPRRQMRVQITQQ